MLKAIKITFTSCFLLFTSFFHSQTIITTVAGIGTAAYSGDGGAAVSAGLYSPSNIAFDAMGNMYIADSQNNCIRKVSTTGTITTFAGNGTPGFSGDGGLAISAQLNGPLDINFDATGNLYVSDYLNNRVRKVNTLGIINTIAGNGSTVYSGDGGPAVSAGIYYPCGLTFDASGNLYVSDSQHNRIRKVSTSGTITTIAGNGVQSYGGDGGLATSANLFTPYGITFDASGNLFIADLGNNVIRKVNTSGTITTIAGNTTGGYSGDGGLAVLAGLNGPIFVSFDVTGNLYITDNANHCIRKVNTSGIISTVAGNGSLGFSGDGGSPLLAQLNYPYSAVFNSAGNMFIGDALNNRVRMINLSTNIDQFVLKENDFVIYPNPCKDFFQIKGINKKIYFKIENTLGLVVKQGYLKAEEEIQINDLPSEQYFIELKNQDFSIIKKIIINH